MLLDLFVNRAVGCDWIYSLIENKIPPADERMDWFLFERIQSEQNFSVWQNLRTYQNWRFFSVLELKFAFKIDFNSMLLYVLKVYCIAAAITIKKAITEIQYITGSRILHTYFPHGISFKQLGEIISRIMFGSEMKKSL